jgi:hypothetical protein
MHDCIILCAVEALGSRTARQCDESFYATKMMSPPLLLKLHVLPNAYTLRLDRASAVPCRHVREVSAPWLEVMALPR